MSDAFATIHNALKGTERPNGWHSADCPNCGKEAKHGHVHFGYNISGAAHCFICGWSGGLPKLAKLLRLDIGEYVAPVRVEKPVQELARWRENPWRLMDGYHSHPEKVRKWQNYKPLSNESIEKHGFGLGRLPFQRENGDWFMGRDEWLIVPIYQDGALMALKGRTLLPKPTDPKVPWTKWMGAKGSTAALFGIDDVREGATVFICENFADKVWLEQTHPDLCAVSSGGITWTREWSERLSEKKTGMVVVALDCDLVGNGGGHLRNGLITKWVEKHPNAKIPDANGPKIVNSLLRAGVKRVMLFQWPGNAPEGAGIDWALGVPRPLF